MAQDIINQRTNKTKWNKYLSQKDLTFIKNLFATSPTDYNKMTPTEMYVFLNRHFKQQVCLNKSADDYRQQKLKRQYLTTFVHHETNTEKMKIKPDRQYLLILCSASLIVGTISCNSQNQSNKEYQIKQFENTGQLVESSIDTTLRLKFTTGIRSILEEGKGNIWFGSHQEGVALFDGEKLTYYDKENGLSDNQIRSIYEDEKGVIWFEGGKGLSSYDGDKITKETERNYDSKNKWKLSKSGLWFKGDEATGYNEFEGNPGVYEYDGQKLSYHAFPIEPKAGEENYYSITTPFVKSNNETVWFGTYGAAIGYNGSDFIIIDNEYLGLNEETGFLHIRSIMEDSKGNLWIGNNGIGVFKYDGEETINLTEQLKLKKEDTKGNSLERIFAIGEDTSGNIWFGTVESGAWRYDGNSITNFTKEDGLESEQIWTIYQSKQGELWFGGANPSGVYRFNGSSFERKY